MIGCGAHYREEQRPSHPWVTLIQIKKFTVIFATQQIALQSFVHCIIYRLVKTPRERLSNE